MPLTGARRRFALSCVVTESRGAQWEDGAMSELSQRDKEILLGQERTRDQRIDALADEAARPGKKLSACESQTMSAAFLAITGIALLIGGWFLNGTTFGFEKGLGLLFVAAAAVWYVYLRATIRRLRAAGVQPG
jgi:hypothetical protein